jgi:hypothetical protein
MMSGSLLGHISLVELDIDPWRKAFEPRQYSRVELARFGQARSELPPLVAR